jgi:hypothetical protein
MSDVTPELHQQVVEGVKAKFEANSVTPGMFGAGFDLAKILAATDLFVQQALPVLHRLVPNATVATCIDLAAEMLKAADHALNHSGTPGVIPGNPAPAPNSATLPSHPL